MGSEKEKEPVKNKGGRPVGRNTRLTEKQRVYVDEYLKCGSEIGAARAVGLKQSGTLSYWLHHNEHVKAYLAEQRKVLAEKVQYDVQKAMAETQDGMIFARETGNANALAKLIELRTKLFGLLIERQEIRTAALTIAISGIDPPALPSFDVPEAEFQMLAPAESSDEKDEPQDELDLELAAEAPESPEEQDDLYK